MTIQPRIYEFTLCFLKGSFKAISTVNTYYKKFKKYSHLLMNIFAKNGTSKWINYMTGI